MGGKSTYLRQTALLCLMAQIGSFVPAREAKLALVDRIFARVGASDNIARGQSTFMVEMQETANILHLATSRSLVVLDEIGRGTATFDGLSIAWAVAEYLASNARARPKTLFATHYHELTDLADALPGVVNYHVTAREYHDEIVFLRKIVPGRSDRSYGIQVARLAGLPAGVVDRAREILDGLEQDELARGGRPTVTGGTPRAGPAAGPVRADLRGGGSAVGAAAGAGRRPPDAARGADPAGRPQARRGELMRIRALAVVSLVPARHARRVARGATRRRTSSRWPSRRSPNNLDPRVGTDEVSQKIQQLVYSTLFALNDRLEVVGAAGRAAGSRRRRRPTSSPCGRACGFTTGTS